MSLLPIIFGDGFLNQTRPSRLLDQHFGVPVEVEDFFSPLTIPSEFRLMRQNPRYYRPWRTEAARGDTGSTVTMDKTKFQVNLDVQQFRPEEISVKISGENQITIEGKHEEKEDEHGFISRHFVRKYVIPAGFDLEKIESQLSTDGILSISAPKTNLLAVEGREIPVMQTGKPAIEKKQGREEKME